MFAAVPVQTVAVFALKASAGEEEYTGVTVVRGVVLQIGLKFQL